MRIARYHRVSTQEQNLQRQVTATKEYITATFDNPEIETYTDASTGTDTERDGYQQLMADAQDSVFGAVVVKSISRISRSIRDLEDTVDTLKENEVALHIIDESLTIDPDSNDPMQRAMIQLLGVFAELEAKMTRQRIKEGIAAKQETDDYHHGPAPLGFRKESGSLLREPNFDQVVSVLEMALKGKLSKRAAAEELDTSRKTIGRAINDRPELYGLEDVDPEDNLGVQELRQRLNKLERKVDQ